MGLSVSLDDYTASQTVASHEINNTLKYEDIDLTKATSTIISRIALRSLRIIMNTTLSSQISQFPPRHGDRLQWIALCFDLGQHLVNSVTGCSRGSMNNQMV
jgi:hypothetical protein